VKSISDSVTKFCDQRICERFYLIPSLILFKLMFYLWNLYQHLIMFTLWFYKIINLLLNHLSLRILKFLLMPQLLPNHRERETLLQDTSINTHCNRHGHIINTYYCKHGFPLNYGKKTWLLMLILLFLMVI